MHELTKKDLDDLEVITFKDKDKKVPLWKRKVFYHEGKNMLLIPMGLLNKSAFFLVCFDGAFTIEDKSSGKLYVDADWVIKEKQLDDELLHALESLKKRLRKKHKEKNHDLKNADVAGM